MYLKCSGIPGCGGPEDSAHSCKSKNSNSMEIQIYDLLRLPATFLTAVASILPNSLMRWNNGKISTSGQKVPGAKPDLNDGPRRLWVWCTLNE
ncbi:hypothetical protein AVEN_172636-1 [Araneus ventricosus]|uniref:Uncharacterized protein n=1 Tax=Araneus ventricosus TaxID=182803 RepID=A0A4Y2SP68_ARAVE|nr:hypothetical protein AVEN_172636-1 [Araneus ventricosus]